MTKLLEPFDAKGLHFKNRIVHVPTTLNMSDPNGYATRRLAAAYGALAAGGYSAIVVGATCVRRDGLINERMLGLYDEDYVIDFRDTVAEIKNNGSLAGIQLFYGGLILGLVSTIPLEPGKGWIPGTVAWGPGNTYVIGNPASDVVPTEAYDDIVECFAQAGRRAKEAGFDFLSFHFCHGSLPHTNLSLLANQGRTDAYADRFYMCEKIIQRTQELCGKDYPLIPRLCVDENLEGGYDIEYFAEHYAPRLHALGISVLDCTFGSMLGAHSRRADIHSTEFIGPSFYTAKVVNKSNIQALRAALIARNIDMPLIGSANLITPIICARWSMKPAPISPASAVCRSTIPIFRSRSCRAARMKSACRPTPAPRCCRAISSARAGPARRRTRCSAARTNSASCPPPARARSWSSVAARAAWNTPSPPTRSGMMSCCSNATKP
ncbi:hypothetical protein GCM10011529_03500 [Polymorphobacter glacialis]|uniref:NADH:flavin oxidoreductase/NADH oxidase N-terminal domain-containing protein n=1 Tax=Sandarakinorhabdus glacialis TaxID=1614636 RepID=A0A916ZJ04_9SPHN|nr:hypothetical protein [Polymorphobacter glacialis]GGE00567.1 hypothetical protein GCM10011529_03500 [Polymorphobacter glacialis]